MNLLIELLKGLWVIIPAYAANGTATIVGGSTRIDGGKKFRGNELLGAGKTVEGFTWAVLFGTLFGLLLILIQPQVEALANSLALPSHTLITSFMVCFGAMTGDVVASFIKRRLGLKRGAKAPLLDQLDFVVGGFLFVYPFIDFSIVSFVTVLMVTPIVHITTNHIAYGLGLKEVPW